VDRHFIEQFARRDWQSAGASKDAYWAERFKRDGAQPAWEASQALLAYVRRLKPEFPTARDRDLDLAHHLELRLRLARAAHALARR
jgi:hypothetical protein